VKTYTKFGVALLGRQQVTVEAYRVTSSKYVLRFFTRGGTVEFPWSALLGFFADDGEPSREVTEDEMAEIFDTRKARQWSTRDVYGRRRVNSLVPPYRLVGEARLDFPDEMRVALRSPREQATPDPNQLNLPMDA